MALINALIAITQKVTKMSRIITIPNVCTMILGRIVNYNTKTYAGIENVPHLCIKTKYGIKIDGLPETEGYAWFGINIINKGKYLLTESDRLPVIKQLEDALSQMVDLLEIKTDMHRLFNDLTEIVNDQQFSRIYSDNANDFIRSHPTNNVQLDVYASEEALQTEAVKEDLSYGGYLGHVKLHYPNGDVKIHPFFIYHRTVIISNYVAPDYIEKALEESLNKFHGLFVDFEMVGEITTMPRRRGPRK